MLQQDAPRPAKTEDFATLIISVNAVLAGVETAVNHVCGITTNLNIPHFPKGLSAFLSSEMLNQPYNANKILPISSNM